MSQVVYDNLEVEMVDAGFHVVLKQDYEVRRDLSDSLNAIMIFIKMMTCNKFSESEIHKVFNDIGLFTGSQPNIGISNKILAIFTK